MQLINTTFAHGNGPYSRIIDWAIEINNVRAEKGLGRLLVIIPLVYPGRQERIMREEIRNNVSFDFLEQYPDEIWLDRKQGKLLGKLMFKERDYTENLGLLVEQYFNTEAEMHEHLDGKRVLENFVSGKKEEFDMRDVEFQLGLNNRMQTGFPNQFYTAGGAGPFDEILERAIVDPEITLDKEAMKAALPVARRMIENQKIIFSNEPGVFSYDSSRQKRSNETCTPPFIHPPKPDKTELPGEGIYLLMTGIDGFRERGMYDAIAKLGMQIYTPSFTIKNLPKGIKEKAINLDPSQINNSNVVAQYARAGWSSVWLAHMAEKGFITPSYQKGDDPEMIFNHRGIIKLGLGAVIEDDPKSALEESIKLAQKVKSYNEKLIKNYGNLDGIRYAAECVVDYLTYQT